ncbi:MAG: hypothetical protein H0X17_19175 [Deltaproteobacteria bacterium]|nr:hypothetical protein [Deltaproteobacteria bacterium]
MKFVGERRALASAILAFYGMFYTVIALSKMVPELSPAFAALAGVYGLAFFSLVAGYFWARWYSVGVGLYGLITAAVGMWQVGAEPVLVFVGATHLAATAMLWGGAMSEPYDGQTAWRQKFHMDENAVQRLGRSVIRAGVSLPFVLLYALAPKPDTTSLIASIAALALTGLGIRALVQLKTWGVLALGAAGALLTTLAAASIATEGLTMAMFKPTLAGGLLIAAALPFVAPMVRWIRSSAHESFGSRQ